MGSVQLVVFKLGEEEYGIEIGHTQEIIRIPKQITIIPDMPSYVEGVFDLRGKVVPIIDLKMRFGFTHTERSTDSRLLVLDLENSLIGIIVDDVSEVIKIEDETIEKLSSELLSLGGNRIQGIARIDDRLILLLDGLKFKTEVLTNSNE
ncbi:chemotaxis signal transduction protein [Desulfosporosinus acidiphilus SJ4]|uniref:Chemotaxis signal transduction protein n=1 Tax=Desulfosporosinus acidiphilus (strain DSM 22704 / JCM 16185 / SJ4) TaxID=646529 RepID=I4D3B7_DESAJ|nr:chemotaxis protein CheW [Desulfosporosinus acidiphilus]AFM40291.1 chemotaxis signal transduction protein [Desulfosporosinus acidiphilus SJ4]